MPQTKLDVHLAPASVDNVADITSIRLVKSADAAALAMLTMKETATSVISLAELRGREVGPMRQLGTVRSLFGTPAWDIARQGQSDLAVVWTKPGSSICPLMYRTDQTGDRILTEGLEFDVYERPRFIRGMATALTASATGDPGRRLVTIAASGADGKATLRTLPSLDNGTPDESMMVRDGSGYILILKIRPAAALDVSSSASTPERNNRRPGILYAVRLSEALDVLGPAMQPAGNTPVFEFDADVLDGRLTLFATTPDGYVAAVGRVDTTGAPWLSAEAKHSDGDLVNPCVLQRQGGAHFAVMQSPRSENSKLLIGEVELR